MPEYLAPGVYVEEVDTGPKPIEGVSTSTAGFVGITQRGPVEGLPVLVTSFADFRRRFGGYLPETWGDSRFLAYAVQGFFENGGKRVYIKRVPGDGATRSAQGVPDGIVTRLRADMAPGPTSARLASLRGISAGTNVTFSETIDGVVVSETRAVDSYNSDTGEITWLGPLGRAFTQAGTAVIIRPSTPAPTLTIQARDPGLWGDDLRILIEYTTPARSEMVSNVIIPLEPLTAAPAFAGGVGPDPVTNPTSINLDPGHGLQTDDVVEFVRGVTRERRQVTVVGDTISWTDPVENDYSAGSTIRLITAARATVTTQVNVPAAMTAALQVGDTLRLSGGGLSEDVTIDPAWPGGSPLQFTGAVTNSYLEGATLTLTSVAVRAGDNSVRVRSSRNFYVGALVELDNGTNREYFTVDAITGNDLTLSGATANDFQLGNLVRLCEFKLSVRYLNEAERIDELETFDGLSMNPAVANKYVVSVVNASSNLVRVIEEAGPAVPFDNPCTPDGSWRRLAGGDDGNPPPDEAFIGQDLGPGQRSGIQALTDIDQISIVSVPGKTAQAIHNALIIHCENLMDRFAVLDPSEGVDIQEVQDFRNLYDTKYAALYYPWLTVRDALVSADRNIPPSGHIIGVYARTDIERGVHKAPANEVIRGIVGLEQIINKGEQDILNPSPNNINVLRDFRARGRGYRVWGARCITSDSDWKYVNVRRLFIFLEESLEEGTQWVVFEPNDEPLWARVRQSVTNFLTRVWRDGALMGTTPEEAFFVKCDRTTMTQDDIDNGRLIMLIGVAPVKPAEFVIIRIGQWVGGSEVEEL
ncbi:MAG: phage tail sheath family protein [Anaerolineae bacterium]